MHGSNPKRTMGYLINTIRRMGTQQREAKIPRERD